MEKFFNNPITSRKFSSIELIQKTVFSKRFSSAVSLIAVIFLVACSSLTGRISGRSCEVQASAEARQLLALVDNKNPGLKTFKGTGKITFQKNGSQNPPVRIAWIGSVPGKIRLALYGASGQPAVSFASDGQWFYLFSHNDGRYYKKPANGELFEKLFSIPIQAADVVTILAGRVPMGQYDCVAVENKKSQSGPVLSLKNRWGNVLRKIYFNDSQNTVRRIEAFDANGDAAYFVQFNRMRSVNGYQVPATLAFSGTDNMAFQFDIDRYWTDVAVSPSVFVLKPPS